MEVNSEKTCILTGISLKRLMRLNCPRGLRSSQHLSPLIVCIGLAAIIITNSFISAHYRMNGQEQTFHTSLLSSEKATTTVSTTKILTTTPTLIDKNINLSEKVKPYDWVKDDFFSPNKGRVVTKNERKYKPKRPLRYENIKPETINLQNKSSSVRKDTVNNIHNDIVENSVDSGPQGESGSNPGAVSLLGIVAAGVKQWQQGTLNKQPQEKENTSRKFEDDTRLKNKFPLGGKHVSNDVKAEEPIIQRGKSIHELEARQTRNNHKEDNPIAPVLSNIAPLASVLMKQISKPSKSLNESPSLAESLMGNIGPILLQNAIGRMSQPSHTEDKGPISPVESLVRNLGPAVLQGVMNGAVGKGNEGHNDKSKSPVDSLVRNLGPAVLQGVMNGAVGKGNEGHNGISKSPVDSLVRNLGPAVLQGMMNGVGRAGEGDQPPGVMSIISKAAPSLLNGLLSGGKPSSKDKSKTKPKTKQRNKTVVFADTPEERIK